MVDTLLYTPSDVTRSSPHVRDAMDLKRLMIFVVIAVTPCLLVGMYNIGYQANAAIQAMGLSEAVGWRGAVLEGLGVGYDPVSVTASLIHGLLYWLPVYLVTLAAGGFWEVLFAGVRNHEINEGFLVTSMLFSLTLPPTVPLWQVAIGISFGVVIGKEVFGGTGKNFLNPALTGRAFLFFAYPVDMSGDAVWTAVDGFSGATPLAAASSGGMSALTQADISWAQAFLGQMQGSIGETSTLACLLGAVFLIYTGVASWRIMAGVLLGMVATVLLFNQFGAQPMADVPWYWHLVLGGYAFGLVFMATDPVSAAMTNAGRWVFGLFIGFLVVLIRVANPAFPEGMMLAILFANVFAPLIDYVVVRVHIRRRVRSSA
jgi:Na+-transporting NADH:ubiquinone oxidoreductase subunit B